MNAMQRTGTLRLKLTGTWAIFALLSQGALALAQTQVMVKGQSLAPRPDSMRSTMTGMVIVRATTAKIDSLIRRLNNLPVGSREYLVTDDSIGAALRALPGMSSGSYTIRLEPSRAVRFSAIDVIPQGWFGFLADGYNRSWDEPGGSFVQYFEYPTVVGVETNSPASRAGVRSGDSLVAYDGRDLLRQPVNLTTLQTPGRYVSVKLRREGEVKEVVIAVEKAPPAVIAERRSAAMAKSMMSTPRATLMIDSVDKRLVETRAASAVAAAGTRGGTTVSSGPAPRAAGGFGGGAGGRMVATTVPALGGVLGAAMTNIDKEMSESLVGMKGKRGVLVTGVPYGSLAERTGLKPLDVILRVGDSEVMSINHLRVRLVAAEDSRVEKVRLLILRAGKTQELYWDTTR